jgi:hypothetical protein
MSRLDFDYDVISQPAVPPPPPAPAKTQTDTGLAKRAEPGHNDARGDQR